MSCAKAKGGGRWGDRRKKGNQSIVRPGPRFEVPCFAPARPPCAPGPALTPLAEFKGHKKPTLRKLALGTAQREGTVRHRPSAS